MKKNNHKTAIGYILDGKLPQEGEQLSVFFKHIATHAPSAFVRAIDSIEILSLNPNDRLILELARHSKVQAVKQHRSIHNSSLKEAVDYVNQLQDKYGANQ
jgi:hypothetical protein